jgi:hypothetical protein
MTAQAETAYRWFLIAAGSFDQNAITAIGTGVTLPDSQLTVFA